MRTTFVKGLNDGLDLELGSNVSIIVEVMEIGRALDAITFEVELTGKELIKFLKKFGLETISGAENIKGENKYKVTAFDW